MLLDICEQIKQLEAEHIAARPASPARRALRLSPGYMVYKCWALGYAKPRLASLPSLLSTRDGFLGLLGRIHASDSHKEKQV